MAITLKAARINAGYTQEQVCEALNLGKSTLQNYESYETVPRIDVAKNLAEFYGMTVDDIIWRG